MKVGNTCVEFYEDGVRMRGYVRKDFTLYPAPVRKGKRPVSDSL